MIGFIVCASYLGIGLFWAIVFKVYAVKANDSNFIYNSYIKEIGDEAGKTFWVLIGWPLILVFSIIVFLWTLPEYFGRMAYRNREK